MLPKKPVSRREFITSVSILAMASVTASRLDPPVAGTADEIVIVKGWVLKRSELA